MISITFSGNWLWICIPFGPDSWKVYCMNTDEYTHRLWYIHIMYYIRSVYLIGRRELKKRFIFWTDVTVLPWIWLNPEMLHDRVRLSIDTYGRYHKDIINFTSNQTYPTAKFSSADHSNSKLDPLQCYRNRLECRYALQKWQTIRTLSTRSISMSA